MESWPALEQESAVDPQNTGACIVETWIAGPAEADNFRSRKLHSTIKTLPPRNGLLPAPRQDANVTTQIRWDTYPGNTIDPTSQKKTLATALAKVILPRAV